MRRDEAVETARDREILETLTELALEVATALKAQIVTQAAAGNAENADRLSLAFTRVSRSIRQTIAFKTKLADITAESAEKRQAREREQAVETSRLRAKKQQVARDVAQMVEACAESENLLTDLHERLMDPDIEDELLTIRVGDVLIGLCDELGIPVELSVWQDKGWFVNEGREAPEPPPRRPNSLSTPVGGGGGGGGGGPSRNPLDPVTPTSPSLSAPEGGEESRHALNKPP